MEQSQKVQIMFPEGKSKRYPKGISLLEVSKEWQEHFESPIVLAMVNNKLKELRETIEEDCEVEFLDISNKDGFRVYQRSLSFLLIRAAHDILGKKSVHKVRINHSISKGFYCEIEGDIQLTEEIIKKIEKQMRFLVDQDIPIEKYTFPLDSAMELFKQHKMYDKVRLFKYRRASSVNLYKLGWLYNYFYGYMVPSTSYLQVFRLIYHAPGFILHFPSKENPKALPEYIYQKKLSTIFRESEQWGRIMKVDTVGALNDILSNGEIGDLIRVSEALQEKKIAYIADKITEKKNTVKIVLIAGPSSSGKTTFAQRLSIQLRVNGMRPHPISIDDYFVEREFTPLDEYGKPDFEALEAIDIEQFNEDLTNLMDGKQVDLPRFNFKSGKREYKGNFLEIKENDVLIIEGIHGLNNRLTNHIPQENKFKIYVSALTQLNIDDHNRIPTTDARLLRRIVRDNQFRGMDAARTIEIWPSVRRGEDRNIFPYQEEADIMFNSALVYELAILKQYAEPLLFQIDPTSPQYSEAKRLIKFLDYFLGVSSEGVPNNSIIREFIGGSCFY